MSDRRSLELHTQLIETEEIYLKRIKGLIERIAQLESENAALKVERDEAEQALSDMAGKFALLAAENVQQAKLKTGAIKKFCGSIDSFIHKKYWLSDKEIDDLIKDAWAEFTAMTARLAEAEEIINDAYYHGDRMNITRAGEYLRALEQARKVGT